jgi:GNAT superfamily N-acetyltransferase
LERILETAIQVKIRDALEADIPILTALKGAGTEIIHRDRLRDARDSSFRYLVLIVDETIIGFACLVSRRPSYWSDANDEQHLPQIVDLLVKESQRGHGYGSEFIHLLERIAAEAGHQYVYLGVEPIHNPRAYALYLRLGYQPEQSKPYHKAWGFTDSQGQVHRGEDWIIDVVKQISV